MGRENENEFNEFIGLIIRDDERESGMDTGAGEGVVV